MSTQKEVDGHGRTGFEWYGVKSVGQPEDQPKEIVGLWDYSRNFDYSI